MVTHDEVTHDEDEASSSTRHAALHAASTRGIYQLLADAVDSAGDWTHRQVVGQHNRSGAWRDYRPRPPSRTPSLPDCFSRCSRANNSSPLPGELPGPPAKAKMVDHYQNLAVRLAEAQPTGPTCQTPADTDDSAAISR